MVRTVVRVFIIGNGFDIHYGIKADYEDFALFLKEKDEPLRELFDELLQGTSGWGKLEKSLGEIDVNNKKFLDNPIFKQAYGELIEEYFTEWALTINEKLVINKDLTFKEEDKFFTFNYTDTLELGYGVDSSRVLHIHGSANLLRVERLFVKDKEKYKEKLLFGHCNKANLDDKFLESTLKNVERNLKNKETIIKEKFSNIDEIIVLNHSVNDIDMPYYLFFNNLNPGAFWKFYCHFDSDISNVKKNTKWLEDKRKIILSDKEFYSN